VECLIEHGADANLLSDSGHSASERQTDQNHTKINPCKELIHARMLQNEKPDKFCATLLKLLEEENKQQLNVEKEPEADI